jgi:recombinational DNA repair ATPase RecF
MYGDFLAGFFEDYANQLREHLYFRFEHTESEIEAHCSRMIHVVSERCAYLEEQNKQLQVWANEHGNSFEKSRQQTEARFAQVMALWYGKTPQDWDKPLLRAPKDFTYEDRQ